MFNFEENNKETLSNVSVNKEDFVLVQDNVKISDKKFESKPTTFIKDAFRRFKKNKSLYVFISLSFFFIASNTII